jgi:hypothetical protein
METRTRGVLDAKFQLKPQIKPDTLFCELLGRPLGGRSLAGGVVTAAFAVLYSGDQATDFRINAA